MRRRRGDNAKSDDVLGVRPMNLARGLAVFDELPARLKRELWESPINLGLEGQVYVHEVSGLVSQLWALERLSTRKIWGPDHPQSSGPRFKRLGLHARSH